MTSLDWTKELGVGTDVDWEEVLAVGDDFATLADAVTDIGSDVKTLILPSNVTVSDDLTIPSNITLLFVGPGKITVAAGIALTLNCKIEGAALRQIFDPNATATVTFGDNTVPAVYPQWFGAKGDGTTDDTDAINFAIAASNTCILPDANYKATSRINIANAVKLILGNINLTVNGSPGLYITASKVSIIGSGENYSILTQGTVDKNIIANTITSTGGTSVSDIDIRGIRFVGIPATVSVSRNNGIYFQSDTTGGVQRVTVENCTFTGLRDSAMRIYHARDVLIQGNHVVSVSNSLCRLAGVLRGIITNNILRDTQLPDTTFTTGIVLESTDPIDTITYEICDRIIISNNIVSGYVNAQAILVHAGKNITITGNILTEVLIGISLNSFNTDDDINDVVIDGNVYSGTGTIGAADTTGNYGIYFGGIIGNHAERVVISNNTIYNANAVVKGENQGGIGINAADYVVIIGNNIRYCYESGIVFQGINARCFISNNSIQDIQTATIQAGILFDSSTSANSVWINGNRFVNITDGIRFDVDNPNAFIGKNHFVAITNQYPTPSNSTFDFALTQTILTANLPAAGTEQNGKIVIEDAGAEDRNLIIYAEGQRFRIDGGASF